MIIFEDHKIVSQLFSKFFSFLFIKNKNKLNFLNTVIKTVIVSQVSIPVFVIYCLWNLLAELYSNIQIMSDNNIGNKWMQGSSLLYNKSVLYDQNVCWITAKGWVKEWEIRLVSFVKHMHNMQIRLRATSLYSEPIPVLYMNTTLQLHSTQYMWRIIIIFNQI